MKRIPALIFAAALTASFAGRAAAETGRTAALRGLIETFPKANPQDDPDYWDGARRAASRDMAKCHDRTEDMDSMDLIVSLMDKYLAHGGEGESRLLQALGELPEFQGDQGKKDLGRLSFGIKYFPGMTRSSLVSKNCRAMLREYFDKGASREQLLETVMTERARLESAPEPKD